MGFKNVSRILLCAIIACAGCRKSESTASMPSSPTNAPATNSIATKAAPLAPTAPVSRIHWLGKKKIAADTNSASLMAVWNLPESARLENQTLDKLSSNLIARSSAVLAPSNQPPAPSSLLPATLRPLLDDLVNEESYLEVRGETNQSPEWIFAIRLDAARAAIWATNFPAALSAINSQPAVGTNSAPSAIRHLVSAKLTHSGDWTIVASTKGVDQSSGRGALLDETLERIEKTHMPFASGATNWLDADIAWNQLCSYLHGPSFLLSPSLAPRLLLAITGDGKNVFTRGQISFATPPRLDLEPWNIPTNLISPTFSSFTAVRGFRPWLESLNTWTSLQIGTPPNQLFCWAMPDMDMTTFFAAPSVHASNEVDRLSTLTIENANPWFATNGSIIAGTSQFVRSQNGVDWKGAPFVSPFLKSISLPNGRFIFGGLFAPIMNRRPLPEPLMEEMSHTNLIYYDFETSSSRIESLLHITQFLRMVADHPQLQSESSSILWLQGLEPKLNQCVTEITLEQPDRLSITRKSSIGLTALELHLLADWLESPDFPHGLHTTRAQVPSRHPLPHKTPAAIPGPPGM